MNLPAKTIGKRTDKMLFDAERRATALAVKERELSRSFFVRPNELTSAILLGFD